MPLVRYTETDINIEITDLVIGDSIIKRKALVQDLTYSVVDKRVVINLAIMPYAKNPDGSYGEKLGNHPIFRPQYTRLTADSTTLVNSATGEILKNDVQLLTDEQVIALFEEGGEFEGINGMLEWEFYAYMAENTPIILNQPIIGKVMAADAEGRFNIY